MTVRWMMLLILMLALALDPALGNEVPGPDGPWRPHTLSRCPTHEVVIGNARGSFEEALELFDLENGGDGAVALEMGLRQDPGNPWLMLLLAQIYLLAGQGELHCQPSTGPVAPTGDGFADQRRLFMRASELLAELSEIWTDDSVIDFLRADLYRILGEQDLAAEFDFQGRTKCSHLESLSLLRRVRVLERRPARVVAPISPDYPEECVRKGIQGEVLLDLLIDPQGRVTEAVLVRHVDERLVVAAKVAAENAGYQAAQLGPYPIWAWLRVPIRFNLH